MLQISKRSEYGLHFLIFLALAPKGVPTSIATVSDELQLPYRFLSQIAGDLKRAKIVKSKEGFKGGYLLTKPVDKITVKNIIEVLDGKIGLVSCLADKFCERKNVCKAQETFKVMTVDMIGVLEKFTVADFIK